MRILTLGFLFLFFMLIIFGNNQTHIHKKNCFVCDQDCQCNVDNNCVCVQDKCKCCQCDCK